LHTAVEDWLTRRCLVSASGFTPAGRATIRLPAICASISRIPAHAATALRSILPARCSALPPSIATVLWPGYTHQASSDAIVPALWALAFAEGLLDTAESLAGALGDARSLAAGRAAGYGAPLAASAGGCCTRPWVRRP
jgi:argininosuccinate lyase